MIVCIIFTLLKQAYRQMAASPKAAGARLPRHLHMNLKHILFLSFVFDFITYTALALFAVDVSFTYMTAWAFLAVLAALIFVLALLPRIGANRMSRWAAERLSGVFAYFISKTEGVVSRSEDMLERFDKRFHKAEPLSEKALLTFLGEQESMADEEAKPGIRLALAGLKMAPEKAGHMMISRKKARTVSANDHVGPILLSELYQAGRKIFPAVDENSEIIGTIRLDRLAELKAGGKAAGALDENMVTAGKDMTAAELVRRFAESGAEVIFVEDEGRIDGIIYFEDLLKELAS